MAQKSLRTITPVIVGPIASICVLADDRWSDQTTGTFTKVGSYVLANLQVRYRITEQWELAVGGRNWAGTTSSPSVTPKRAAPTTPS